MDIILVLILILFIGFCLRPFFILFGSRDSSKNNQRTEIIIEEPEESEEERQFREYGDCFGYSYYGDDEK